MGPKEETERAARESIEELFAALESPLLGYAQRLTGSFAAAEDVVQDAFMKLHAQFEEVREPRHWLYRTVHNQAINLRRKEGKIVAMPTHIDGSEDTSTEATDPQPLPDEAIARWEGIGQVRLTLASMDSRSRELIRLKFHEDLSYKEIAQRTGLKTGHVGYLLHHALKGIAAELAKIGILR